MNKTKHKNFIGSGGLFMNVKLNKSISELDCVKKYINTWFGWR